MNDPVKIDLQKELSAALEDPALVHAGAALGADQLGVAESLLRTRLRARATDVVAIRMLAEVAGRLGRYRDAETLLRRALELAPDFDAARANLVFVLQRQSKFVEAHAQADRLLAVHPDDVSFLAAKAAVLVRTGGYDEALMAYQQILARSPDLSRIWVSYGHVLKTVGRQNDSIAAYRRAISCSQTLGDAWWSLANLKTVRLNSDDIAAMQRALGEAPSEVDRYHLQFALGKALEDAGRFQESFHHYLEGNRLRRAELPYDPEQVSRHQRRTRDLLTRQVLAQRSGVGNPATDPIFVVGLPRAGSTLVEQILASHSHVEGTMELPDITSISADLSGRQEGRTPSSSDAGYLESLLALMPDQLFALGRRYIENTAIQRKSSRPRFIDKMPNNFAHIGLIHLILPNATIIDVRRHPMANCVAAFKQHFSRGQGFTYDLEELGRYYRDYVALMEHYDEVLPGRVHRVSYETLVAQPEVTIRALLAHCKLEFEPACLAFHENPRAVRTASSEQVRQPMNAAGIGAWRHYQAWLGPLRGALGNVLDRFPDASGDLDRA